METRLEDRQPADLANWPGRAVRVRECLLTHHLHLMAFRLPPVSLRTSSFGVFKVAITGLCHGRNESGSS